jgi:hypothetical protein
MAHFLLTDIPEDVYVALKRRAEQRGQSLEQFVAGELCRIAERTTVDATLDRIGRRRGGQVGLAQAAEDLRAARR